MRSRSRLILLIIWSVLILQSIWFINLYAKETIDYKETLKKELIELEREVIKVTNTFKKVVKLVGPSVVKIKMMNKDSSANNQNNNDQLLSMHHADDEPLNHKNKDFNLYKTFKLPERNVGSGFIIDKNGFIVTNYHVIKDFDDKQIEVTVDGNRKYIGKVIGFDPGTDIALIKIEQGLLQPIKFGDDTILDVGDWVIAIGNPYGHGQTISTGVISATSQRETDSIPMILKYEDFMQTDASINPGCSGGPLVNMRGEVIGINAAIATRRGGFQGIGFAIPASIVQKVVNDLIEKK